VRRLADTVVGMHDGESVERGPTADVYDHPPHPYTRTLHAAAPTLKQALAAHRARAVSEGRQG